MVFNIQNVSTTVQGPFGFQTQVTLNLLDIYQITDNLANDFISDPNFRIAIIQGFINLTVGSDTFTGQPGVDYLDRINLTNLILQSNESALLSIETNLLTSILIELRAMRRALTALATDGNKYKADDFDPKFTNFDDGNEQ